MPPHRSSRRRLLHLSASGLLAGSAGCLSDLESAIGSDATDHSSPPTETPNPVLEYVNLSNHHPKRHAVSVRITRDAEVVHEAEYRVDAFDPESDVAGTTLIEPPAFERTRGAWAVGATLDSGSARTRVDLLELPHRGGCINVTVRITPEGDLTWLNDTPDCQATEK